VRAALTRAGLPWSVVFGSGLSRTQAALACVQRALAPPSVVEEAARWHWFCERCGDANCERHPPQLWSGSLAPLGRGRG
jgi:hypothetical protein